MSKVDYKFSNHVVGEELLHTPEGVRDIYGEECARKLRVQDTDLKIFRPRRLNFLTYLAKKEEPLLQKICIVSLTEKEICLRLDRILPLLLPEV